MCHACVGLYICGGLCKDNIVMLLLKPCKCTENCTKSVKHGAMSLFRVINIIINLKVNKITRIIRITILGVVQQKLIS